MKELVFLQNDEALTTSLKVAEYFKRKHKNVVKAIEKLAADCNGLTFKPVKMFDKSSYIDEKGEQRPMYFMNRDGFSLLVMGFNNTPEVLKFKLDYIQAFNAMEQKIIQLMAERKSAEWLEARKLSKVELRQLTDLIRDRLIPLMIQEGASKNAVRWVYKNYVSMIQNLLGIKKGTRDELPADLLYELGKVQQMAMIIIKGLISAGISSKQIYVDTKQKINSYAQLSLFNQRFLN